MLVLVNELTVSAAMPKSHNLMWPAVLIRIFDGFTSAVNIMGDQDYKMLSSAVHNEYIDIPLCIPRCKTYIDIPLNVVCIPRCKTYIDIPLNVVCIPRCKTLRLAFRK